MFKILNKKVKGVEWFIPIIYGMVICIYPFPETFDIARFFKFYDIFSNNPFLSDIQINILINSPDIIAKLVLLFLAELGLPIEIFLFFSAYITGVLFLLVFKEIYISYNKIYPSIGGYLLIYFLLSVAGILSGIRNIQAWAFVMLAMVFLESRNEVKIKSYIYLLYGGLVHYAAYAFLPIFYFRNRLNNISINQILKIGSIISIVLLIGVLNIEHTFFNRFGNAWYHKFDFYFYKSEFLISSFRKGYLSFLYKFSYTYLPFIIGVYLLVNAPLKFQSHLILKTGMFLGLIFLFFPDIMNRYTLFLKIGTLFYVISSRLYRESIIAKIYLYVIVIFALLEQYFFWKQVLFYNTSL
ncbi:hypothetical protein AB4865_08365 [Capnocytophaga sp. ARDL2]|uniref:hypothetical protein n=1 Tax=Capnocytophaga sp. ARDL2 TaxID=3238809 RepID=UPI003557969C